MARRARSGGRLWLAVLVAVGLQPACRGKPPGKAVVNGDELPRPGVLGRPLDPRMIKPAASARIAACATRSTARLHRPKRSAASLGRQSRIPNRRGSLASGFPYWDRYGTGFPAGEDYPYRLGTLANPYLKTFSKAITRSSGRTYSSTSRRQHPAWWRLVRSRRQLPLRKHQPGRRARLLRAQRAVPLQPVDVPFVRASSRATRRSSPRTGE